MKAHPRLVAIIDRIRQVDGQGLAEYALILALIAIVSIVALIFMGSQVSDKLSVIGSTLESVANSDRRHPWFPRQTARQRRAVVTFGDVHTTSRTTRERRHKRRRGPCRTPCVTHGFLPFPPNGPRPFV